MRGRPDRARAGCHGGLQAVLLVPEAPAAGLRSPPSPRPARAESATHLFAGASAVEQHRVPNGGRGPGPQVRNGVSSRTFHAVSGPDSLDSQTPGVGLQQAESQSASLLQPKLEISFSGFEDCLPGASPFHAARCPLRLDPAPNCGRLPSQCP